MKIIELKIKGMTCPGCSAAVAKLTDELPGITSKTINHATDSGLFEFDEQQISVQDIIAKINEGHYKVDLPAGIKQIDKPLPACPVCGIAGQKVFNSVFKSNLKPDSFRKINMEQTHYICYNPDCDNVFYNESGLQIHHDELKRPLWYKKSARQKIICYCNNIDKQQIKTAVQKHELETWEDITGFYRKKPIEKCEILNPTGYCCRDTFDKVVGKMKI